MRRALVMLVCWVGLAAAGCTTGEPGGDGPDAGGDVGDSIAPGQTRLTFAFVSRRAIPGEAGGTWDATLTAAHLDLADVRVIADVGVLNHPAHSLDWSGELGPMPLVFGSAPPGIYSQLAASIEGYGVSGTVVVGGEPRAFEIVDTPHPGIGLGFDLRGRELVAGDDVTIDVEVDFRDLVDQVSWNDVAPDGDGVLRVDSDSALIDSVRDEVDDLFGDDD